MSAAPTSAVPPTPPTPPRVSWGSWAFLGAFVAILFAFRAVLFPFLMAIFLAYLVEPVVAWMNRERRFGIRWGRAPVLILMYAVVILSAVGLVSCAVRRIGSSATAAAKDLQVELGKSTPAATFALEPPSSKELWIPAGTRVRTEGGHAWRTMFTDQVGAGPDEARVLLERDEPGDLPPPPLPAGARAKVDLPITRGTPLFVADAATLEVPEDAVLRVVGDDEAQGLELFVERWVIAPVAGIFDRWTGKHFGPGLVRQFVTERSRRYGPELGNRALTWSRGGLFSVIGSLYEFFLILMLTAFLVIDRKGIARFFSSMPPPHLRARYETFMGYVDRGLSGVIRGQLVICVVNGFLTWIGLLILGVPYASLLAFVAGVLSLIPVFGTIASSIPIVLVALATKGVASGLLALGWIFFIHILEGNVFNPLIMGTSAELHPVVIVFSLLAGEHAFGVWGALLAVPTASLLVSAFKYHRHEVLGVPPDPSGGHGRRFKEWWARLRGRPVAPTLGETP